MLLTMSGHSLWRVTLTNHVNIVSHGAHCLRVQADSTRAGVKDLDVLLSDESLVLILDDTEVVWENHKANLIQVTNDCCYGSRACKIAQFCGVFAAGVAGLCARHGQLSTLLQAEMHVVLESAG